MMLIYLKWASTDLTVLGEKKKASGIIICIINCVWGYHGMLIYTISFAE